MEKDKHRQIAEANRNLYNGSPETSEDFEVFAGLPYVTTYVANTIHGCIQRLGSTDSIMALDIGTGYGHLLKHLINHVAPENIHALDISEKTVDMARKRFPKVHLHVGDFLRDFEPSLQFNLILAYSVLHHFYDWKLFLDKVDSLLKSGGVIYLDHEPLDGLLSKVYQFFAKIKHRHNRELILAEYHQFYGNIIPFELQAYLVNRGYDVQIYFTNISLIGGMTKKLHLNVSPFFIDELLIDNQYKRFLRHGFLSYKIIAQKP